MQRFKHGHAKQNRKSPTYSSWRGMMTRCYNKASKDYSRYGGEGCRVVARWHVFKKFLTDMGERPKGKTLDRISCELKLYCKKNCRWATKEQQARNKPGRKGQTSIYKGVYRRSDDKKWIAQIKVDDKRKYLGCFTSEKAAAEAYNKKAKNLWGDDAYLNPI